MKINLLFGCTLRRQLLILLIILAICTISAIGIAPVHIAQQVICSHTARFGGKMLTQAAYPPGERY